MPLAASPSLLLPSRTAATRGWPPKNPQPPTPSSEADHPNDDAPEPEPVKAKPKPRKRTRKDTEMAPPATTNQLEVTESTDEVPDTDLASDTSYLGEFLSWVRELYQRYPHKVVLVQVGSFYELYEFCDQYDEAIYTLGIKRAKKQLKGEGDAKRELQFGGFPTDGLPSYAAKLVSNGFSVVIVNQDGPMARGKSARQGLVPRTVDRIMTAGTIVEDELINSIQNSYVLAVVVDKAGRVGLSWCDVSTGDFSVAECDVGEIQNHIARIQPVEVLLDPQVQDNFPDVAELFATENFRGTTRITPDQTTPTTRKEALEKMMSQEGSKVHRERWKTFKSYSQMERDAAGSLVTYILENYVRANIRLAAPTRYDSSETMLLNSFALSALEIRRSLRGDVKGSLLKEIDRTKTAAGARLLAARLLAPSTSIEEINRRLDIVQLFDENPHLTSDVQKLLTECKDIERSLQRIEFDRGRPDDLLRIMETLKAVERVRGRIRAELGGGVGEEVVGRFRDFGELIEESEGVLEGVLPKGSEVVLGTVRSGVVEELDLLRGRREELDGEKVGLRKRLEEVIGFPDEVFELNDGMEKRDKPFIIATKVKNDTDEKHILKVIEEASDMEKLTPTRKNTVRFRWEAWTELANKIEETVENMRAIERDMFDKEIDKWRGRADEIFDTCKALAEVDVSAGLAQHALDHQFVRPILTDE
ncbi:hypothetical protein HDV00_005081 [Rhizophlyctis rosea]|nr:hypothetical protein HDV00_005081 [Rhizophlyctis rosea]